jgi:membrane fusion protein (multidrug efflux system)
MLTLDRAIGDRWLIASGLEAGERLIVEGAQKVRPGNAVKVVPFNTGGKDEVESKEPTQSAPKSN